MRILVPTCSTYLVLFSSPASHSKRKDNTQTLAKRAPRLLWPSQKHSSELCCEGTHEMHGKYQRVINKKKVKWATFATEFMLLQNTCGNMLSTLEILPVHHHDTNVARSKSIRQQPLLFNRPLCFQQLQQQMQDIAVCLQETRTGKCSPNAPLHTQEGSHTGSLDAD